MTWFEAFFVLFVAFCICQSISGAAEHIGRIIQDCTAQAVIFARAIEEERRVVSECDKREEATDKTAETAAVVNGGDRQRG